MSQAARLAINRIEQGMTPDAVVRTDIRRLCEERLKERVHGWLRPGGLLFTHVFCRRSTPCAFVSSRYLSRRPGPSTPSA